VFLLALAPEPSPWRRPLELAASSAGLCLSVAAAAIAWRALRLNRDAPPGGMRLALGAAIILTVFW